MNELHHELITSLKADLLIVYTALLINAEIAGVDKIQRDQMRTRSAGVLAKYFPEQFENNIQDDREFLKKLTEALETLNLNAWSQFDEV